MLAMPINKSEPGNIRIRRGPYWALMLILSIISGTTNTLDLLLLVGWVYLTYARVKDIGWHGAWTLACIIPLFNIVIGFMRSELVLTLEKDND